MSSSIATAKWHATPFAEIGDGILLMGGDQAERERYASALLGWTGTPFGPVAVYRADTIIETIERDGLESCAPGGVCVDDEHDHLTEAVEYFEFNVVGAWVGGRTPIYVYAECDTHDQATETCPCPLAELDRWGGARELLALEQAGGRTAGATGTPGAAAVPTRDYIAPEQFPIDRLNFARAETSILSAGSDPNRFWGAVAIPTEAGGPHLLLYVYGQSNWSVVRPMLAYWGVPETTANLVKHATRRALHPTHGYRAYGTPIFLDPHEAIGRAGLRRLVQAAQRGEGAVPLAALLGTNAPQRKSA